MSSPVEIETTYSPKSPSKKKEKQETYFLLSNWFDALLYFETFFDKNKRTTLQFTGTDNGSTLPFSVKEFNLSKKEFKDTLKISLSSKRPKVEKTPGDFKGDFAPVQLSEGLLNFFRTADFGTYEDGSKIIDMYPSLREGYSSKKVIIDLLYHYVDQHKNTLKDEGAYIKSDKALSDLFNSRSSKDINFVTDSNNKTKAEYFDNDSLTNEQVLSKYPVKSGAKKNKPFDARSFNRLITFKRLVSLNVTPVDISGSDEYQRNIAAEGRNILDLRAATKESNKNTATPKNKSGDKKAIKYTGMSDEQKKEAKRLEREEKLSKDLDKMNRANNNILNLNPKSKP
jgi:hypothetical protein